MILAASDRKSRFLGHGDIDVSFEFFPPQDARHGGDAVGAIRRLEPLNPTFVSVTYGAGGSTRERTHRTVARMLKETALKPAAHLTCVEATRGEVDEVIRDYWDIGIRHIVALRGDPAGGVGGAYTPHARRLRQRHRPDRRHQGDRALRGRRCLYPQNHPESADASMPTSTC